MSTKPPTQKRRAGNPPRPAAMLDARPDGTTGEKPAMTALTMTPQLMAWGKLNSGQLYNMIAQDLDRAIWLAGLTSIEGYLFLLIRERSYGKPSRGKQKREDPWPDPIPCRLNLSEVARRLKKTRQQVSRAMRNLIASGLVFEFADGRLLPNKAAHDWIHPRTGERRLTPEALEECRAVQRNAADPARASSDSEAEAPPSEAPALPLPEAPALHHPKRRRCVPRSADDASPEAPAMRPSPARVEERTRGIKNSRREELRVFFRAAELSDGATELEKKFSNLPEET